MSNFKYYTKIPIGDEFRYFYSKEEYDAYLGRQKKEETSPLKKVSNFLDRFRKTAVKEITSKTDAAKAFVEKTINKLKVEKVSKLSSDKSTTSKNSVETDEEWEQRQEKEHKYLYKEKLSNGKTRYFYSEKEYQTYLKKQEYQKNEPSFMKGVKETLDLRDNRSKTLLERDDMSAANDKYYSKELALTKEGYRYTINCMLASNAYELRRRGYDVEAKPLPEGRGGYEIKALNNWYEDPKIIKLNRGIKFENQVTKKISFIGQSFDTQSDIDRVTKDILKNNPPGSRGNLCVGWKGLNSGHSMVYEVDSSNNITIRDAQVNKIFSLSDLAGKVDYMDAARTDNLKLKPAITEVFNEK